MTHRYTLLTLLALTTGAAFSHAELEGSSPEDGETLLTPPSEVALVFSESVELAFSTFKVYPLPSELAATAADHAGGEHDHSDDTATAAFVSDALSAEGDEANRVDEDATSQGSEVTLTLQDHLPTGAYIAMWKALSSDGHTVEGYLTFSYQP